MCTQGTCELCGALRFACELISQPQLGRSEDHSGTQVGDAHLDQLDVRGEGCPMQPACCPTRHSTSSELGTLNSNADRITREPIPIEHLKTYQQAIAQYHLHPEDKFLNGDFLDRGTTVRRHIRVTGIEYIGKESNKWDDQYYFGFDPDEEIHYGSKPPDARALSKAVQAIADTKGLRITAKELRMSRTKFSKGYHRAAAASSPEIACANWGIFLQTLIHTKSE